MRGRRAGIATVVVAAGLGLAVAPALADSLPEVDSGQRPGPPLLYEDAPEVPHFRNKGPFDADPLLVSGTDAYRDGEYLYQDYLFDDRGANTQPGRGSRTDDGQNFSPTAGDVFYPRDEDRYANNAADIVELRMTRDGDALVYRLTLNTLKEDDATVVGIGVDTDEEDEPAVEWPDNADMSSPGLDHFITAWGDGGRLTRLDGEEPEVTELENVEVSKNRRQMTIRVPYELTGDPDDDTWSYVAGTGVHDGEGAFEEIQPGPAQDNAEPRSGGGDAGSNVFNLAFRFFEPQQDTPVGDSDGDGFPDEPLGDGPYDTAPGVGNWFEDEQARKLQAGTTERLRGDDLEPPDAEGQAGDSDRDAAVQVDFGDIGDDRDLHEPSGCRDARKADPPEGCEQARILPSALELFDGVRYEEFPQYGGRLQPYLVTVPPGYDEGDPAGLTFSLHSLGGSYTQYKVFSPNQLRQFGDDRDDIVVTPLGHGPSGWYTDEAEVDFFEAWADTARHFDLDPEQVALTGYSMGGYGTYKLGVEYPDLFGRAFTTVGPPARGQWLPMTPEPQPYNNPNSDEEPPEPSQDTNTHPLLENVRWVPFMNWIAQEDQLVPFSGPNRQQDRFDALGLRSTLWTFQGDHFTLAIRDEWEEARDFLGKAERRGDPGRISYAFLPDADRPELELRHDHAYWISGLRAADESPGAGRQFVIGCPGGGDERRCPARGEIGAHSLAFGEGKPETRPVAKAVNASPGPAVVRGTKWDGVEKRGSQNELELDLNNIGRAVIDGARARLEGDHLLRVRIRSTHAGEVRLDLDLPDGASVRRQGGAPAPEAAVDSDGVTFSVAAGERTYLIRP